MMSRSRSQGTEVTIVTGAFCSLLINALLMAHYCKVLPIFVIMIIFYNLDLLFKM